MTQISRCAQLHALVEVDRAKLLHECLVQEMALRRVDSRVSAAAHLPLRPRRAYAPHCALRDGPRNPAPEEA